MIGLFFASYCVPSVQSQVSCYFTNMEVNPSQGSSVPAGQSIAFTITLTGSCPSPGVYTVRADIIDTATSQIISSNQIQLAASGPFAVTVSDPAVVPAATGNWRVQVNAYLLLDGSNVGPPSQLMVGLTVVPFSQPATTQSATPIYHATTVTSALAQSTFNAPPNATQIQVLTETTSTSTMNSSFPFVSVIAISFVVFLTCSATYVATKRRTKAKSAEDIIKCVKCGTALPRGTKFCDECGTEQPSF